VLRIYLRQLALCVSDLAVEKSLIMVNQESSVEHHAGIKDHVRQLALYCVSDLAVENPLLMVNKESSVENHAGIKDHELPCTTWCSLHLIGLWFDFAWGNTYIVVVCSCQLKYITSRIVYI
jgi:hypothetical protein